MPFYFSQQSIFVLFTCVKKLFVLKLELTSFVLLNIVIIWRSKQQPLIANNHMPTALVTLVTKCFLP